MPNDNDNTIIKLIGVTITDICNEFRRPILMLGFAKSKEQGMRVKGAVFLISSFSTDYLVGRILCRPIQCNSRFFVVVVEKVRSVELFLVLHLLFAGGGSFCLF